MQIERRWKLVALVASGIAIGVVLTGTPAGAHVASWTHNWNTHIKPKADARYLPGGNLPAGRTIRGAYRISGNDQGVGMDFDGTTISFGYTLATPPTGHFIQSGATPPPQCPGTSSNPQAARGHLCVYELSGSNVQSESIATPLSRFGVGLSASSVGDGLWVTVGTWAVRS